MKIYTGNSYGIKLDKVKEYGLGIMISSSPTFSPVKEFSQVPCALDNGAFVAYKKGYPFPEKVFLNTLDKCYKLNIPLDFIVCPDIIAGGEKSLNFSIEWATGRLKTAPSLALVVQDGMTAHMIDAYVLSLFECIFVGGTVEWKWKTADGWVKFAHASNKKCHIGQVGQKRYLSFAKHIQADSVDSTSIARNDSWLVVEEYKKEMSLFDNGKAKQALQGKKVGE